MDHRSVCNVVNKSHRNQEDIIVALRDRRRHSPSPNRHHRRPCHHITIDLPICHCILLTLDTSN